MTFLPIVDRELRVASRKRSTYFLRLAACGVAIGIGLIAFTFMNRFSTPPQQLGEALFGFLAVVGFVYSIGVGLLATADSLSVEKREGTMGLLFLTDLKGYDVVVGKLVANSLNAFYGMVAIFPIMAVPLLLGGVTAMEFWRVMITSVNLMFFSLTAGLFASSISRDERRAMTLTLLLLIILCAGPPLAGVLIMGKHNDNEAAWQFFLGISPATDCWLPFVQPVPGKPDYFWPKLAVTFLYSCLFFVAACRIVPRSWHESATTAKPKGLRAFWNHLAVGGDEKRVALRRYLLEINPFLWLTARNRGRTVLAWICFGVAGFIWFWGVAAFGKDWMNEGVYIFTAFCLQVVMKYFVAAETCQRFVEDRRMGAMELMLSTPLEIEQILKGQRSALLRQFAGPVLAIVLLEIFCLLAGFQKNYSADERVFWVLFFWSRDYHVHLRFVRARLGGNLAWNEEPRISSSHDRSTRQNIVPPLGSLLLLQHVFCTSVCARHERSRVFVFIHVVWTIAAEQFHFFFGGEE